MKQYSKLFAQVAGTILAALLPLVTLGHITPTQWVNVAIIAVGACAVFAGPNVPGARYTKVVLSALAAALTVLTSAIIGGISTGEWIQIVLAILSTLGVYSVNNVAPALGEEPAGAPASSAPNATGGYLG
jgi:hypothetical protein